jgi:hypothetical protein
VWHDLGYRSPRLCISAGSAHDEETSVYYLKVETTVGDGASVHDYFEAAEDGTFLRQVSRVGDHWWSCAGSVDPDAAEFDPPIPLDELPADRFISADDFERVWRHAVLVAGAGRAGAVSARGHFSRAVWRCTSPLRG